MLLHRLISSLIFLPQWPGLSTTTFTWLTEELFESPPTKPVIFYYWHAQSYPLLMGWGEHPKIPKPFLLMHDGFASKMHEPSLRWFGWENFEYKTKSKEGRSSQLIHFLQGTKRRLLIATDSGGPYGKVKPGILHVAKESDALLLPVACVTNPVLVIGKNMQHECLLPYGRAFLATGSLLCPHQMTPQDCQDALEEVNQKCATAGKNAVIS